MAERRHPGEEGVQINDAADSSRQDDRLQDAEEQAVRESDSAQVIDFRSDESNDASFADPGEPDEVGGDPVDLAELQSDDALLDALGGTNPDVPAREDDETLAALLLAWRRDVDAAPIGELVDTDTAVAAIADGRRPRRLRRRHLIPVATAAAVLMITFTGVGLAARDAEPGDILWGVAQVLYSDRAHVVEAASQARIELANANAAFLQGDRLAAEAALKRAQQQMQQVDAEHGLKELQAAQASLAAKFENDETPSTATSPQTHPRDTAPWPSTPPMSSAPPPPPISSTPSGTPSSSQPPTSSSSSSSTNETTTPTTSGSNGTGLFGSH